MAMTIEEQKIALAMWRGWTKAIEQVQSFADPSKTIPLEKWLSPTQMFSRVLPNYPSDLNAVHELEKRLPHEKLWLMTNVLMEIVSEPTPIAHATASQRCEALCRVLWPERWT